MFQMTPRETRQAVIDCMEAGLVASITSSPGLGKSSIVAQIAKDFGLTLIDLRLSQCAPEDLMGLPMKEGTGANARATFVPFNTFPLEGDKKPGNGWILLLDEFNSAPKSVQAAAYKIVLDKMVGQARLHPDCYIVCAGNLATDRAIVNPLSTAMQSRLVHIEMKVSHKEFMAYALTAGFDHRVLGFLDFQPKKLHHFKPDHADQTFACPRTWEFASRLIKERDFANISLPLLAGTLSDGIAQEFYAFLKEYSTLPSYASICKDPLNTIMPTSPSTCYALATMLMDRFVKADFPDVVKYTDRMPPEFRVIYLRGIHARHPDIRRDKTYIEASGRVPKFLTDDADEESSQVAA